MINVNVSGVLDRLDAVGREIDLLHAQVLELQRLIRHRERVAECLRDAAALGREWDTLQTMTPDDMPLHPEVPL